MRHTRTALTCSVAAVIALALAGCSSSTDSAPISTSAAAATSSQESGTSSTPTPTATEAPEPAAASTGWAEYFYPAQAGAGCTLTLKPQKVGGGVSTFGSLKQTVKSVTAKDDALIYQLGIRSLSGATGPGTKKAKPTTQTLTYRITSDGTVDVPWAIGDAPGLKYEFDGFLVYPSVEDLKAGKSTTSTIKAKATPTDKALAKELKKQTTDKSSTLKMTFKIEVSGLPSKKPIKTKAGTYTDYVGLKTSIVQAIITNSTDKEHSDLTSTIAAFGGANSIYFAHNVGMVKSVTGTILGDAVFTASTCSA